MKYRGDFKEFMKVMDKKVPSRPVLFELFMNDDVYRDVLKSDFLEGSGIFEMLANRSLTFSRLGYDYSTIQGCDIAFKTRPHKTTTQSRTHSLNDEAAITDRADFDAYEWPCPKSLDYGLMDRLAPYIGEDMRFLICGPCGVLENTIAIVGYDALCMMLYDNESLASDIFEKVGETLFEYYKLSIKHPLAGGVVLNDDWGFNTQPMLSPKFMRKYVFPWHKRIVKAAHEAGMPAVLHSCGCFDEILEDMFDIGYDGRHSYEDNIMPVEKALEVFKGKMAVIGGIDLDFLIRRPIPEIEARAKRLLDMTAETGGYILGSGNSIPEFVPLDHYYAMIKVALDY